MSLTAFNRLRRMQQVEEMKPENIKEKLVENTIIEPVVNIKEEPVEKVEISGETTTTSRRRNNRRN